MKKKQNIVHIAHPGGHRKAYLDLFVSITNFQPEIGPISKKNIILLLRAEKVLFATVGKHFRRYFAVSLIRSLFGKPTCTIFLGAVKFRANIESQSSHLDKLLIKIWKLLPKQKLLAILPYNIEPSLSRVTNDYISDPQMWDLWFNDYPNIFPQTALSKLVEKKRKGREVLIFLGKKDKRKSFGELVAFTKKNRNHILTVAAGRVAQECAHEAAELLSLGMMVEDRYISDNELLSLYNVADFAWCYYAPVYDQPSGIYGRAIQLGVTPVVRSGSMIARISDKFSIPCIKLKKEGFESPKESKERSAQSQVKPLTLSERRQLFTGLRDESLNKLKNYLELEINLIDSE